MRGNMFRASAVLTVALLRPSRARTCSRFWATAEAENSAAAAASNMIFFIRSLIGKYQPGKPKKVLPGGAPFNVPFGAFRQRRQTTPLKQKKLERSTKRLPMGPDMISDQVAPGVLLVLPAVDDDSMGDGLDDVPQRIQRRLRRIGLDVAGVDMEDEPLVSIGHDEHAVRTRQVLGGLVLIVDEVRGDEDEQQNKGDHHVVVERPARVRP